jgi:hypothetical protein
MPGTLTSRAVSPLRMELQKSSTLIPDSTAGATFGPTPLMRISSRNKVFSAAVPKPNSSWASSRTTRWVSSVTASPTGGSRKKVDIGASTS